MYRVIRAEELERGLPTLLRELSELDPAEAAEAEPQPGEQADETAVSASPGGDDSGQQESPAVEGESTEANSDPFERDYERGYTAGYEAAQEEAYQKGYAEARAEAREEVTELRAEVEAELEQYRQKVDRLAGNLQDVIELAGDHNKAAKAHCSWATQQARREAVELGLKVAERIVRRQLTLSPQLMVDIMDELLRYEESPRLVEIRVAPEHTETIIEQLDVLQKYAENGATPRVLGDPDITAGFVLETDRGGIDAQLETQLDRLGEQLESVVFDEESA